MGIHLHSKHGVNPTMVACYYCGEPKEIMLVGARVKQFKEAGLASEDEEMNQKITIDQEPCDDCKKHMEIGIILISVKDDETDMCNPYRTGKMVVMKEDAIKRILKDNPKLLEHILKERRAFVPDSVWKLLGLPE